MNLTMAAPFFQVACRANDLLRFFADSDSFGYNGYLVNII